MAALNSALMRSFSGYDLRKLANEVPHNYLQRKWDPWTTEYTWDPTRHTEYFARYALEFYPTRGDVNEI